MTTPPLGVERRITQRFALNLPVSLRQVPSGAEGLGFTQDLSSRGAFLFTDLALNDGDAVELTLKMPSEITLGENMRVRCRGLVLRIVKPADFGSTKIGVAVCLKGYEYLPEMEDDASDFRRIAALHSSGETDHPATPAHPRAAAH
jgi:hypothetical protein